MKRLVLRALPVFAAGAILAPAPLPAQTITPKVFYACYVPSTGVTYRIKEPGLAQECSTKGPEPHIEFSWTDGLPAHDHGALNGLTDDDHPHYLLVDAATRSLVANLNAAGFKITNLAAATAAGDAVRYEQAVKVGDVAAGDLAGSYPEPSVVKLQGNAVATTPPADGHVMTWNDATSAWTPVAPEMVVSDHGGLGGLTDDDHPHYLLVDGTRALTGALSAGGFKLTNLAEASANGDAVRFEQAVKSGDAAGGDLSGTYLDPTVAKLQGTDVSSTAPTSGQVLSFDGTSWTPATPASGVTDHGDMTGLEDDDHTQYLLTDGVRHAIDGFAVTGTKDVGSIPAEGAGTRLMWYPAKGAFRAGRIGASQVSNGLEWDDVNVGSGSTAMGVDTEASGPISTAFGFFSKASGDRSTAMGQSTVASGLLSTVMGFRATASGDYSIAMGVDIEASGDHSTAMGRSASTNDKAGTFVYGDNSSLTDMLASTHNQFAVRAQHIWLGTDNGVSNPAGHFLTTSTGAYLSTGGTWTNSSDVNRKEDFREMDGETVLAKIARMPIQSWSYKTEAGGVRHVGPTAQDFHAAFGLGDSDEAIATVDADGINLLAIQALEKRTTEQAREIEALWAENRSLLQRLASVEEVLRRFAADPEVAPGSTRK